MMLVTGNMPMMLAGFNFITYTLSVPVGMYFVERAGRRKLMLIGLLVMGGSLVVAGPLAKMAMSTPETEMTKKRAYGAAVAAFIFLYTCGFGSTWITCSYVFPPSSLIATPPPLSFNQIYCLRLRQLGLSYRGFPARNPCKGRLLGHGVIRLLGRDHQSGNPIRHRRCGMVGFHHVRGHELPPDHPCMAILCRDSPSSFGGS